MSDIKINNSGIMDMWKFEEKYNFIYHISVSMRKYQIKACNFNWNVEVIIEFSLETFEIIINLDAVGITENFLIQLSISPYLTSRSFELTASTKEFNIDNSVHTFYFKKHREWHNRTKHFNIQIEFFRKTCLLKQNSNTIAESERDQQTLTDKEENIESEIDVQNVFRTNIQQFQENGQYTDITIRCDTEIFKAHRVILSARSPVFNAMFQNPMKETLNQEVEIKDMKPEVFRSILAHIYSNQNVQESDSIDLVFDILAAADKYMLQGLKHSCIERIKSSVAVTNAIKFLLMADLYDAKLKEYVIQFICKEYDALKNSSEWKESQEQKPSLIIDIMAAKIDFAKKNAK